MKKPLFFFAIFFLLILSLSFSSALISYDSSSHGNVVTGTSLTYSHTTSGSARILFVGVSTESASDLVTGITYNGVSMTRIQFQSGNGEGTYLYYLINPSLGANNVVISTSSSTGIRSASVSYTGALQSGQPDASTKQTTASTNPFATSLTTVADKSWMVSYAQSNGFVVSASTGTTFRDQSTDQFNGIGDSGGAITPPASYSMSWSGGGVWNIVQASFSPSVSASVVLDYPQNNSNVFIPINFNVTITPPTGANISNFTISFWNQTGVFYGSMFSNASGNSAQDFNITNSSIDIGNYTTNVSACFTDGSCVSSSNYTFKVSKLIYSALGYNVNIFTGTYANFLANLSISSLFSLSSINLIWNGTTYPSFYTSINSSFYNSSKLILIPYLTTSQNVSFYWSSTLNDGSVINSSIINQTINPLSFGNCSTYSVVLYNFTIKDEDSFSALTNTNAKINLQIYDLARSRLYANYSGLFNQTNPFAVCMNGLLSSSDKFSEDLQIQYGADSHETQTYYIQNKTLSSADIPTNISLYDLLSSESQVFTITFRDESFLPVSGALIQILRNYVDLGMGQIVEISKTDFNGNSLGHFILNNVGYNITVVKNGKVLGVFDNVIAQCQNPSLYSCSIDLNSASSQIKTVDYTQLDDFSFTLNFNRTTRLVSSNFVIPSSSVSNISLMVTLLDQLGNTTICNPSQQSISGTLSCSVPINYGNGTLIAQIYKNGILMGYGYLSLQSPPPYGANLVFLALFYVLTLIGVAISDNPLITGVIVLLGGGGLIGLDLVMSTGIIGAGATFLWFVIAVVIVLIKGVNRQ